MESYIGKDKKGLDWTLLTKVHKKGHLSASRIMLDKAVCVTSGVISLLCCKFPGECNSKKNCENQSLFGSGGQI